eukprot:CAMPEP_0194758912 /NCGR_PEP_ID=MMETSP0323_2-20130528/12070_1 /TAXON_ID=2866 ORGANISM="Crypthecodinium cohnii, Strain Seligo" /NCGR_SAMPLE_ID=MMETSP0323_2 /ASSEMBLY_ACC=CAM_ASM_000346 /LENGTH=274 /DNA_ID=CAMNT_0039679411 /DNA_START=45 /DNA_END=869 /DNA_ORIENTATION=+
MANSGYDFSKGKVALVTGGGSGIGRAICLSLARRGVQHIVAADLDKAGAEETARQVEALGLGCKGYGLKADIGSKKGVNDMIDYVEGNVGLVDIFFANAGIAGDVGIDQAVQVLDKMMAINVYQSIWAAQRLLPDLANRQGAFCITASAAGLLMQLGALAYSTTKHAARAVAEWIAVTYGDAGLHTCCLCPMLIETKLTPAFEKVAGGDGALTADVAAESACKALEEGRFFAWTHQQSVDYIKRKNDNIDRWMSGMRKAQSKLLGKDFAVASSL